MVLFAHLLRCFSSFSICFGHWLAHFCLHSCFWSQVLPALTDTIALAHERPSLRTRHVGSFTQRFLGRYTSIVGTLELRFLVSSMLLYPLALTHLYHHLEKTFCSCVLSFFVSCIWAWSLAQHFISSISFRCFLVSDMRLFRTWFSNLIATQGYFCTHRAGQPWRIGLDILLRSATRPLCRKYQNYHKFYCKDVLSCFASVNFLSLQNIF